MKGIIFNLLEAVVTQEHGGSAWDDAVDDSGVAGAYTSVGQYPDEEFIRLLDAIERGQSKEDDEPRDAQDLLRWFGRHAMPMLAQSYPAFFEGHRTTRSFLLTLNDIIHPEVRKLYPDADVPVFDFEVVEGDEHALRVGYLSGRRLCALADGFIKGAATHFQEHIVITHESCMLDGDDRCELLCTATPAALAVHVS